MTGYSIALFEQHAAMLAHSGITPEHARHRGYVSVDTKTRLAQLGIAAAGRLVPGLLVPSLRGDGSTWGYQYRPDTPRDRSGKTVKYETPLGQRNGIDVPPGVGPNLGDPSVPLWVTEGVKKADAGTLAGLVIVALPGVWSWRGRNEHGGKTAVADWHDIALNGRRVILAFDGDVTRKRSVRSALDALAAYLTGKDARVEYLHLPDHDDKVGLDDYLNDGHSADDLWRLVHPEPPPVTEDVGEEPTTDTPPRDRPPVTPVTLHDCRTTFTRWFGKDYDLDALHGILAAAAVQRLDGDPLWLLIVSGSGNAKTETVQALTGSGGLIVSTISSEAALLSATSKRERAKDATGGLLREIGTTGTLVIKDVTSILSMGNDQRGQVLGALREIHDGEWVRKVGAEGGRSLPWTGRITIVGAVTTAWDQAHAVIASMGDRFPLLRIDSSTGRQAAGRKAIGNTGSETQMRKELADAVAGVLAGMTTVAVNLTEEETNLLLAAADLVTLSRTGVIYDYRGDVVDAHAPEMPTRFAKQLAQVVRGSVAVGMGRTDALRLALRCARDSMPPLRLAIINDLTDHPGSTTQDVRKRLNKPRATVDRQLQALHMLGVLDVEEVDTEWAGKSATRWYYTLASGIDAKVLDPKSVPEKSVDTSSPQERRGEKQQSEVPAGDGARVPTDFSGTDFAAACTTCGTPLATADQQAHTGLCGYCEAGITPDQRTRRTTA